MNEMNLPRKWRDSLFAVLFSFPLIVVAEIINIKMMADKIGYRNPSMLRLLLVFFLKFKVEMLLAIVGCPLLLGAIIFFLASRSDKNTGHVI